MKNVPPGCESVEFGRQTYVVDPGAPLRKGRRACVWGFPELPGRKHQRIATSGIYRPRAGDNERGLVRLANWCGPKRGWEENTFPCPPNFAGPAVGVLVTARKRKLPRRMVEIHKFVARRLRGP